MRILKDFLSEYGATLIYAIISAILGYIGIVVKSLITRIANDKTKKDVVSTCVRAVEQIFTDLHGQDKLEKCIEKAVAILSSKGIDASADEIYMLIEAAVKDMNMQMNDIFNSDGDDEGGDETPADEDSTVYKISLDSIVGTDEEKSTDEVQE